MKRTLLALPLIVFSMPIWANVSSELLACSYARQAFTALPNTYVPRDESLRPAQNLESGATVLTLPDGERQIALILPSGFYKLTFTEDMRRLAISKRSDYVHIHVTGLDRDDLFLSVRDDDGAFRANRKNVDYGFGNFVAWGKDPQITYTDIPAQVLNAQELSLAMEILKTRLVKNLKATRDSLNYPGGQESQRITNINNSIPRIEAVIKDYQRQIEELRPQIAPLEARFKALNAKRAVQTDEDVKEALDALIGGLQSQIYELNSKIASLENKIMGEKSSLTDMAGYLLDATEKLAKEKTNVAPHLEKFNQVLELCRNVTGNI